MLQVPLYPPYAYYRMIRLPEVKQLTVTVNESPWGLWLTGFSIYPNYLVPKFAVHVSPLSITVWTNSG